MELAHNTVLITGGGSGIGLALAERFLKAGSEVLICGRDMEKLEKAKEKNPTLHIRQCDVARPEEREALFSFVLNYFPKLNVFINNAGIQQRLDLKGPVALEKIKEELTINLEAPLHFNSLFVPFFLKKQAGHIINVTSGLSFAPLANVPVYCATKAAMHSYTLSLRHQLKGSEVRVTEIIPPAVNTDLGGKGLHTFGVDVHLFADAVMTGLEKDQLEITFGYSEKSSSIGKEELKALFDQLNSPR